MKSAAIISSGRHIIGTLYISIMCLLCAHSRVFLLQTHNRNRHHDSTLRPAVKPLASGPVAAPRFTEPRYRYLVGEAGLCACRTERARHKTKAVFPLNDVLIISATWRSRGHPDKIFQPVAPKQEFTTAAFSFKTLYVQVDNVHKEYECRQGDSQPGSTSPTIAFSENVSILKC